MTDYAEEHASELEVLQSIYPDELNAIDDMPSNPNMDSDDEDEAIASMVLSVTYTPTYPDELPKLGIVPSKACGLNQEDIQSLITELEEIPSFFPLEDQGQENLGMAMVFTLASQLKDSAINLIKAKANQREKEAEARLMESLKAEETKFIGTRVTPELFLEWKVKFDHEMELLAQADLKSGYKKIDKKKLTGKQLFEKDSKLAQSDMQYMEEGDIDIDMHQFERLGLNDRNNGDAQDDEAKESVLDMLRNDTD